MVEVSGRGTGLQGWRVMRFRRMRGTGERRFALSMTCSKGLAGLDDLSRRVV
jgi:hypothetical protein